MFKSPTLLFILPLLGAPHFSLAGSELSIGTRQPSEAIDLPYECTVSGSDAGGITYLCKGAAPTVDQSRLVDRQDGPAADSRSELKLQIDDRSELKRLSDQTTAALTEFNSIAKIKLKRDGTLDSLTLGSGNAKIQLDGKTLRSVSETGRVDPLNSNIHLKLTVKIPGL